MAQAFTEFIESRANAEMDQKRSIYKFQEKTEERKIAAAGAVSGRCGALLKYEKSSSKKPLSKLSLQELRASVASL